MNIFTKLTPEERKRFLKMGKAQQEAFRKEKEEEKRMQKSLNRSLRELDEDDYEDDLDNELDFQTTESSKTVLAKEVKINPIELPLEVDEISKTKQLAPTEPFERTVVEDKVVQAKVFEEKQETASDTVRVKKVKAEHNMIYINTVWDATYSATKIFPTLYFTYKNCIETIKAMQKEYKNTVVKYGLTVMNNQVAAQRFSNGEYFTEDADEFIEKLLEIKFCGGNFDGEEDFNEAIEEGIRIVTNHSEEHANRGIIFFTDSLPKNNMPDFINIDGCKNGRGLRFAVGYAYNNRYLPQCNIVDANGKATENARNDGTIVMRISDLFQPNTKNQLSEMVHNIMKKVSVTF